MYNKKVLMDIILSNINVAHGSDFTSADFTFFKPPDLTKRKRVGVVVSERRCIVDLVPSNPAIGKVFRCYLKPDIVGGASEIRQDPLPDVGGYSEIVFHVDIRIDPTFYKRVGSNYICPDSFGGTVDPADVCILSMSSTNNTFTDIVTSSGQFIRMPCRAGMPV